MAKKALFKVGKLDFLSLCATCVHMPAGEIPQNNTEVNSGRKAKPHMYCAKKSFFPDLNFDEKGKPFYDVAKCDKYEEVNKQDEVPTAQV